MATRSFRRFAAAFAALVMAVALVAPAACRQQGGRTRTVKVRIGTLPTEDTLPLYVAQQDGLLKDTGIDLEMVVFPSAQERDAALVAGKIDGFMGDVLAVAALAQQATPVRIVTIMLGAGSDEGRFGIAVPKGSSVKQPMQLRGVPIAVSSNTITEYVVDSLLRAEGLADDEVKKVEVKKIPVRMQLLLAGQVKAAGLPDPLLAFVESKGARVIIDDTTGANLSQTVLAFRSSFIDERADTIRTLLEVQGAAAEAINDDPEKYRTLLVDKAKLPPDIAETYTLNAYPQPQLPAKADVEPALEWLVAKGLVKSGLTYESLVQELAGDKAK